MLETTKILNFLFYTKICFARLANTFFKFFFLKPCIKFHYVHFACFVFFVTYCGDLVATPCFNFKPFKFLFEFLFPPWIESFFIPLACPARPTLPSLAALLLCWPGSSPARLSLRVPGHHES